MTNGFNYSEKVQVSVEQKAAFLEFAERTVKAAGKVILPHFRADVGIENKLSNGKFDPVTEADKAGERLIRQAIEREYPEHGIYGEEYGFKPGNGLTWVIDPIDGTRAFMSGMLHWGVLLGLFDGEEAIVGAMYQPYTEELFSGDSQQAFFARGSTRRQISTRHCDGVSSAVLATTGYDWFDADSLAQFNQLRDRVQLYRLGGDCYLYDMLAMGYVHIGTDGGLNPYDIQAIIPIVRGAGGVITTYSGENPSMGGNVIASANPELHDEVLALLNGA